MPLADVLQSGYCSLDQCIFLASGTRKLVYQIPQSPEVVLKIVRPEIVTDKGQFIFHKPHKQLRSSGVYREFEREILQYLSLCRSQYGRGHQLYPIATPLGLIQTDRGLAMLSERIVGADGSSAPSLAEILQHGAFNREHADALNRFFGECARLHIVFAEVNTEGLMFTTVRNQRPEFVLVDGIGERNLIPLKSWSKAINLRRVRIVERQIWAQVEQACGEKAAWRMGTPKLESI